MRGDIYSKMELSPIPPIIRHGRLDNKSKQCKFPFLMVYVDFSLRFSLSRWG